MKLRISLLYFPSSSAGLMLVMLHESVMGLRSGDCGRKAHKRQHSLVFFQVVLAQLGSVFGLITALQYESFSTKVQARSWSMSLNNWVLLFGQTVADFVKLYIAHGFPLKFSAVNWQDNQIYLSQGGCVISLSCLF